VELCSNWAHVDFNFGVTSIETQCAGKLSDFTFFGYALSSTVTVNVNNAASLPLRSTGVAVNMSTGSPTRGAIRAFIGGKLCIAAAHLAKQQTDHMTVAR